GRIVEAPRVSAAANGVTPTPASATMTTAPPRANGERVIASPAARRLARERGIALDGVRGTGPRGRITMSDVHALPQPRGNGEAVRDGEAVRGDDATAEANVTLSLSKGDFPPQLPAARRAISRKMPDVGLLPLAQVETVARVDAVKALIER